MKDVYCLLSPVTCLLSQSPSCSCWDDNQLQSQGCQDKLKTIFFVVVQHFRLPNPASLEHFSSSWFSGEEAFTSLFTQSRYPEIFLELKRSVQVSVLVEPLLDYKPRVSLSTQHGAKGDIRCKRQQTSRVTKYVLCRRFAPTVTTTPPWFLSTSSSPSTWPRWCHDGGPSGTWVEIK